MVTWGCAQISFHAGIPPRFDVQPEQNQHPFVHYPPDPFIVLLCSRLGLWGMMIMVRETSTIVDRKIDYDGVKCNLL